MKYAKITGISLTATVVLLTILYRPTPDAGVKNTIVPWYGSEIQTIESNPEKGRKERERNKSWSGVLSSSITTRKCLNNRILRNGWDDPRVQYAYAISCWDMDFIKTIEAESKWDINAIWDWWNSFWLCQINKIYNPEMQKEYRELITDNEKVLFCYYQYQMWVKRWVIRTRLYGYNHRNLQKNTKPFTFP